MSIVYSLSYSGIPTPEYIRAEETFGTKRIDKNPVIETVPLESEKFKESKYMYGADFDYKGTIKLLADFEIKPTIETLTYILEATSEIDFENRRRSIIFKALNN